MIAVPIVQTVCFGVYVWHIVAKFGVIASISESWYVDEKTNWKFIFFIWSISFPTLALYSYSPWFVASAISLGFVSGAPAFRSEKLIGTLHSVFTVGGIAFACYALIRSGEWFSVIACMVASVLLARLKVKNMTWWTEIACFSAIEIGVITLVIK